MLRHFSGAGYDDKKWMKCPQGSYAMADFELSYKINYEASKYFVFPASYFSSLLDCKDHSSCEYITVHCVQYDKKYIVYIIINSTNF